MIKLVAFDLDGTLAKRGGPIIQGDIEKIKEIISHGVEVVVCSGKPTYYLCGLMRQVGLKDAVMIGENGATMQFGVELPPKRVSSMPYSDAARAEMNEVRAALLALVPDMWYQPNEIMLTPFPKDKTDWDKIDGYIKENEHRFAAITIYRGYECFDFLPSNISKAEGVKHLCALMGVAREETVCVGDGVNDYPMFEYANIAVGVNVREPSRVDVNTHSCSEALDYIISAIKKERNLL